jgi:hypothetical protein
MNEKKEKKEKPERNWIKQNGRIVGEVRNIKGRIMRVMFPARPVFPKVFGKQPQAKPLTKRYYRTLKKKGVVR